MKRRTLLQAAGALGALALLPSGANAAEARLALTQSNLVYLSPITSSGKLSRCQAEVWYVMLGADVYVCTDTDSWRAKAARLGLTDTKVWVGDLGVWRRVNYQALPSLNAMAAVAQEEDQIELALAEFGRKYASEWNKWGPRFRKGLKNGSRTMLRYTVTS